MRTRFHIPGFIMSAVFGTLTAFGIYLLFDSVHNDLLGGVALVAALFGATLAMGYLGMRLGFLLTKGRYAAQFRTGVAAGLITALLCGAVAGGVGQLVFSLGFIEHTEEVSVDDRFAGLHIVLLLDGSTSMREERPSCNEAAGRLIDSLDQDDFVQVIAFANGVKDRNVSSFLPMDAANRTSMKDFVDHADLAGGTNFNIPLKMAAETLNGNHDGDHVDVILMLTDGEAPLDEDVKQLISGNADMHLFTVRITSDSGLSDRARALVSLADMDFPIAPKSDGTVDVDDVLNAFNAALDNTTVTTKVTQELGFTEDLMLREDCESYWWRWAAQAAAFALAFAAAAFVYYRPGIVSLLGHLLLGAAVGILAGFDIGTGLAAYCVFALGAFTGVKEVKEDV